MIPRSEQEALAALQKIKTSYQSHLKTKFEPAAKDCRTCEAKGVCCTDAHFVNVHITRLEAVAIRDTLERTPRLTAGEKREVYVRARETVARYDLRSTGDTFTQTYSCPLFTPASGCLVHQRAKPSPCIQHACYDNWQDLPPDYLQSRVEHRVEQLNSAVYGRAWAWLPTPVWLGLVDPESNGVELSRLLPIWNSRPRGNPGGPSKSQDQRTKSHRRLPVLRFSSA